MALIKCKECGGRMSDRATECPHCGCPIEIYRDTAEPTPTLPSPKPKKRSKYVIIGLSAIIITLTIATFLCVKNDVFASRTLKITPEFTEAIQKYDQIDAFSEGMAAVRRDGKWGYINLKGEEVIPCQFSDAFPPGQFTEGLACVVDDRASKNNPLISERDSLSINNEQVGFINKKGTWIIEGNFYTETPTASEVWRDDDHTLPSFKDGKCAVWNMAATDYWNDNNQNSKIILVDQNGNTEDVADSIGYKYFYFHPYQIVRPHKDIAEHQEKHIVYDNYAVTIARDTTECDNGARLVTWQILDANNYPYQTKEKTVQYFLDKQGNSTLSPAQEEAMEHHLSNLITSLTDKHNKQLEEERRRQEYYSYSTHNNFSAYSTDEGRNAYLEVLRLQKEVRTLIDKSAPYRRIMQSEVYGSYHYQIAKMENMEILDLAIRKQKQALSIARNKLHDNTLIRELSGQLDVLHQGAYSN